MGIPKKAQLFSQAGSGGGVDSLYLGCVGLFIQLGHVGFHCGKRQPSSVKQKQWKANTVRERKANGVGERKNKCVQGKKQA